MALSRTSLKASRQHRVRRKLRQVSDRPRLSVFRSNQEIYVQIIDDAQGKTVVAASSKGMTGTKTEQAVKVGELIAKAAKSKNITAVYFDRGHYKYHGRVKALAEAARSAGLIL